MTLNEEKDGEVVILGLSGKFDTENAKTFLEKISQIVDGGERYVLLDFTNVTYINSTGLRALILLAKRLGSSSGKLVLAGVNDQIQKVFKISGLTSIFVLQPTRAEALGSFPT